MIAEIISTGDEVLTGTVVDSNAAYIAARLYEIGIPVGRHVSVGDELKRMADVLSEAGKRADIGVVTGGLGPTVDDITAQAAAAAAGVDLQPNPTARAYIEEFFKRFNRPLSESEAKQGDLPAGAQPILNPVGTAPGFSMNIGGCRFYFLPGVPFEMRRIMKDNVIPALEARYCKGENRNYYREKCLSLFGLPESRVNERLVDLTVVPGDVRIGMLSEFPVIHVKLSAYGRNPDHLSAAIENASASVMDRIGEFVYSDSGQTMEEVVGALLAGRPATLALAESCTGGLIGHRITNVAGSSGYFNGSIVTYANKAKKDLLGVSADTLEAHGAVSEEVVREMAAGTKRVSATDYGLAVSGVAGPGGGTAEKPVGTVCIGLCGPEISFAKCCYFPFDNRLANKRIFAEAALDTLRRKLIGAAEFKWDYKGE
ncbi:MAG: competence/damage-inducible protein A [Desulfobacteraceae bacterium]|nr:competence/damage-inducible protein A [Desulfobacteraceae bacterium]